MKIAFYGSSLLSSYWNGAATYYRGLLRALAAHGHDITFYEPDAFERQSHRDIDPPRLVPGGGLSGHGGGAARGAGGSGAADLVVKASGVGVFDDRTARGHPCQSRPDALRVFWDVDAPATLAEMRGSAGASAAGARCRSSIWCSPMAAARRWWTPTARWGPHAACPIYNALDPHTHHPVPPDPRFAADLSFLGNRLPDREARVG